MGQTVSNQLETLKDDVIKEAHTLKEVVDITHEDFLKKVKELNHICKNSTECEGRKLQFFIKKDSDSSFLWKQTVRISCMRVVVQAGSSTVFCDDTFDDETLNIMLSSGDPEVEVFKLLSLRQFLLAYKMIIYHYNCMQSRSQLMQNDPANAEGNAEYLQVKPISTSMILDKIMSDTLEDTEECIICMERKPEVTLPCAHAYCLFCIEQWNVSNKTCPVCRETMENTDDSWVTPEIPESSEMNAEMQKALTVLTLQLPEK